MDLRQHELNKLKEFNNNIQKEVTLLLQNLQWDPKQITEKCMVACKYDTNHRILPRSRQTHESQCRLTKLGYVKEDCFLPDPVDPSSTTLVKFSQHEITDIINKAASNDPSFRRGVGSGGSEPLTVERLQQAYTSHERRAIHDAVVSSAPFCHDLTDLELLSSNNGTKESEKKSRLEILAELRDMKRRRAKYRVAPKTRNYSDVLRDVIRTQMESYGEASRLIIKTEYGPNCYVSQRITDSEHVNNTMIKQERESPENYKRNHRENHKEQRESRTRGEEKSTERRSRENNQHDRHAYRKDDSYRGNNKSYHARNETSKEYYTERNRERKRDDDERRHRNDPSKERSRNYENRELHYGRSQGRRYDRQSDTSRDSSKHYERSIKQERASMESDTYASSSKDYYRDHRGYEDRSEKNKERNNKHSNEHENLNERERELSQSNSTETSRKRHRSRSKERRHKDKKRRHDKDKYHKRDNNSHWKYDYISKMTIKQERESP